MNFWYCIVKSAWKFRTHPLNYLRDGWKDATKRLISLLPGQQCMKCVLDVLIHLSLHHCSHFIAFELCKM